MHPIDPIRLRTWAQIDLDALRRNYEVLKSRLAGGCRLMCVIKADAYGHGAPSVAAELEAAGADCFGVSNVDEAIQLRRHGVAGEIVILGYTRPDDAPLLVRYNITQTVYSAKGAAELSAALGGEKIKVHIKADTGMNRLGFKCSRDGEIEAAARDIAAACALPGLEAEGLFTHFPSSGDPKSPFTARQFELFGMLAAALEKRGINFKYKHASNSAAFINFPEMGMDMVRCGLLLFGLYPARGMPDIGLRPCMELKSVISHVHEVRAGEGVSYDRTYRADRDMLAGTIPIGYADGFSRLFSNSSDVIVRGKRAPVIGRVCMDQTVIDLTDTGAEPGDEVTIFGEQGGQSITVDQLAAMMETINYEVVCLIGKRVPRVYLRGGHVVGTLNYINY